MGSKRIAQMYQFEITYRAKRDANAQFQKATINAHSKTNARELWKFDNRAENNSIVSIIKVGQ